MSCTLDSTSKFKQIIVTAPKPDFLLRPGEIYGLNKPLLAPGFIENNGCSIGEVETATGRAHGDTQPLLGWQTFNDNLRQPLAFAAKQQHILVLKTRIRIGLLASCRTGKNAFRLYCPEKICVCVVHLHAGILMIVQPCPAQLLVIKGKSQWLD